MRSIASAQPSLSRPLALLAAALLLGGCASAGGDIPAGPASTEPSLSASPVISIPTPSPVRPPVSPPNNGAPD